MLQSTVDVTRTRREDGSKLPRAPSEVAAAVDASPFPWSSARDSPVKYRKDFFLKKILSMWETLLDFYYGLVIVFLLDNFYFNHFKFLDKYWIEVPRGHTNHNTFPWIQICQWEQKYWGVLINLTYLYRKYLSFIWITARCFYFCPNVLGSPSIWTWLMLSWIGVCFDFFSCCACL